MGKQLKDNKAKFYEYKISVYVRRLLVDLILVFKYAKNPKFFWQEISNNVLSWLEVTYLSWFSKINYRF